MFSIWKPCNKPSMQCSQGKPFWAFKWRTKYDVISVMCNCLLHFIICFGNLLPKRNENANLTKKILISYYCPFSDTFSIFHLLWIKSFLNWSVFISTWLNTVLLSNHSWDLPCLAVILFNGWNSNNLNDNWFWIVNELINI